jgi:hypothetical protein
MVKLEERAARIAEWQAIFGDIMKEAPWAPIYNEKHITYHSARSRRSQRGSGPLRYAAELPLHLCEGCAVKAAGRLVVPFPTA